MTYTPLLGGILGTVAMTLFTEFLFRLLKLPYHVVRILSHMLRWKPVDQIQSRPPITFYVAGVVLHYLIGVLFAYAYQGLLQRGILGPGLPHAAMFGGAAGLVGIMGWSIFFARHPAPPAVDLRRYLPVILGGHVILGMVLFYTYRATDRDTLVVRDEIPLCYLHVQNVDARAKL